MELISLKEATKLLNTSHSLVYSHAYNNKIKRIGILYDKKSILDYIKSIEVIDLPNEIWQNPKGYSRYMCSNFGRVVSTKYKGGYKKILINSAITGGYYKSVFIDDNGKYCSMNTHRLICLAFNYNQNWLSLEVNHIDSNRLNNNIENLEWCTRQENIKHYHDNKTDEPLKGEQIGNSKLKEWQVLEIRAKFKPRIYGRKKLAKEYNISAGSIKNIILRHTWKHI